MKRSGCRCGPLNDCGEPGGPGDMCECDGQGNCTHWIVGDFNLFNKTAAEIEASTTRFLLDENFAFVEVGLFAAAGLQIGDTLSAVVDAHLSLRPADSDERFDILNCRFTDDVVKVIYERGGKTRIGELKNPKARP
jgi:hypothetical protein